MSLPTPSEPAGTLKVALPLVNGAGPAAYPPPVRATLPVGIEPPALPLTVTVTESVWVVVRVNDDGVTTTEGICCARFTVVVCIVPGVCWRKPMLSVARE